MGKNDQNARRVFGDTNRAGGVPDFPAPADGPVYLEGRLVLSLSFQGGTACAQMEGEGEGRCGGKGPGRDEGPAQDEGPGELLERYRLWDDLSECWWDDVELRRFEMLDAVVSLVPRPRVLWRGAVDTRARVLLEPDLDEAGIAANRCCDLRWRLV